MTLQDTVRMISLAAIWGGSFLFLRLGAPVFGPAILVELRVGIAALFLFGVCRWLGRKPRLLDNWRHFLVLGWFNSALPFMLFAFAAQTLSASLLSILNSTAPIFAALLGVFWLRQPVSRSAGLGLALGVVGVGTLVSGEVAVRGEDWWLALAAGLLAPFCYGIASAYAKKSPAKVDPIDNAHGSMWASVLLVLPFALFLPIRMAPKPLDWAAVTALGVICTGAAYLLYFKLIEDVGPMRALSVTFLIPVFGVFWGVLLLGETVSWSTALGGALILLGTALANGLLSIGRSPNPARD